MLLWMQAMLLYIKNIKFFFFNSGTISRLSFTSWMSPNRKWQGGIVIFFFFWAFGASETNVPSESKQTIWLHDALYVSVWGYGKYKCNYQCICLVLHPRGCCFLHCTTPFSPRLKPQPERHVMELFVLFDFHHIPAIRHGFPISSLLSFWFKWIHSVPQKTRHSFSSGELRGLFCFVFGPNQDLVKSFLLVICVWVCKKCVWIFVIRARGCRSLLWD